MPPIPCIPTTLDSFPSFFNINISFTFIFPSSNPLPPKFTKLSSHHRSSSSTLFTAAPNHPPSPSTPIFIAPSRHSSRSNLSAISTLTDVFLQFFHLLGQSKIPDDVPTGRIEDFVRQLEAARKCLGKVVQLALAVLRELVPGELDLLNDREKFPDVLNKVLGARAASGGFAGDGDELLEEFGGDLAGEEVCNRHGLSGVV
ncbi:1-deoxy-D-xylulose 5-phosphate synthase 1 [Striga asiatica]|uniref:1-deoxy-D-xylulose 5-phosphate synthase 1 n=1 Tax=Striga asiatica TaxID=4170 RepID=A0A5A7PUL8_STRAF|nr:1-deoxy-D-xylulose 5-phosphate synthase 1 [Striga asiatica]